MTSGNARAYAGLTDHLWQQYRAAGDSGARTQLLDRYIGLVHHSARELWKRGAREVELDELISAGAVGLVQALESFDPARGNAFSTYAVPRIRGAMLDELRSRDWMPRSIRTRRKWIAATRAELQHRFGRPAEPHEMAEAMKIDMDTYWRWADETDSRVMVAFHQAGESGGEDGADLTELIPDPLAGEPDAALTLEETLEELRESFASLPEKERLVLTLYYYEELTLKQIGEVLHVTESRISQIRTRALRRLRDRVKGERG